MKRIAARLPGFVAVLVLLAGFSTMRMRGVRAAERSMGEHMVMTTLQPKQPGDQARADAVVAAARKVAERYVDYRQALADGYKIFMPDQPQHVYHFVLESADDDAKIHFDPMRPPALLYVKTADKEPGYKLVGVMYTDRSNAPEEELNARIPLSIAQWHEHLNMCIPSDSKQRHWLTGDTKFGLNGSITTEEACQAAGGRFVPHLSGWMVHVYPFESDPAKVWSPGMDDEGGTHSSMPGMKM